MPIKTPYDRHLDRIDDDVFRMLLLIIPDAARKLRRGIVRTVACNEASGCGVKRTPWMLVIYALNEMVRGDDAYLAESTPFETPEYPDFTKLNGEVVKGSIERYPDFDLNTRETAGYRPRRGLDREHHSVRAPPDARAGRQAR